MISWTRDPKHTFQLGRSISSDMQYLKIYLTHSGLPCLDAPWWRCPWPHPREQLLLPKVQQSGGKSENSLVQQTEAKRFLDSSWDSSINCLTLDFKTRLRFVNHEGLLFCFKLWWEDKIIYHTNKTFKLTMLNVVNTLYCHKQHLVQYSFWGIKAVCIFLGLTLLYVKASL